MILLLLWFRSICRIDAIIFLTQRISFAKIEIQAASRDDDNVIGGDNFFDNDDNDHDNDCKDSDDNDNDDNNTNGYTDDNDGKDSDDFET